MKASFLFWTFFVLGVAFIRSQGIDEFDEDEEDIQKELNNVKDYDHKTNEESDHEISGDNELKDEEHKHQNDEENVTFATSSGEANADNGDYDVHVEVNVDKKTHEKHMNEEKNVNATLKATKLLDKIVKKLKRKGRISNLTSEFNKAIDETLGLSKLEEPLIPEKSQNEKLHYGTEVTVSKKQRLEDERKEQSPVPIKATGFDEKGSPLQSNTKANENEIEDIYKSKHMRDESKQPVQIENDLHKTSNFSTNEVSSPSSDNQKATEKEITEKTSEDLMVLNGDQETVSKSNGIEGKEVDTGINNTTNLVTIDEINIKLPTGKDKSFKIDIQNLTDKNQTKEFDANIMKMGDSSELQSKSTNSSLEIPGRNDNSGKESSFSTNLPLSQGLDSSNASATKNNDVEFSTDNINYDNNNSAEIVIQTSNNEQLAKQEDEDEEDEEEDSGNSEDTEGTDEPISNINRNIASSITGKTLTLSFQENTGNLGNNENKQVTAAPYKLTEKETHESDSNANGINGLKNKGPKIIEKNNNNIVDMHKGVPIPKLFNDSLFEQAAKVSNGQETSEQRHVVLPRISIAKNFTEDVKGTTRAETEGDDDQSNDSDDADDENGESGEENDDNENEDDEDKDEEEEENEEEEKEKRLKSVKYQHREEKNEDEYKKNTIYNLLPKTIKPSKMQKRNELTFEEHSNEFDRSINRNHWPSQNWSSNPSINEEHATLIFKKGEKIPKPPSRRGVVFEGPVSQLPELLRSYKKSSIVGSMEKKKKVTHVKLRKLNFHNLKKNETKIQTGERRISIPMENPNKQEDLGALMKQDSFATMQNMPEFGTTEDPWSSDEVSNAHSMLGTAKDQTWPDPYSFESQQFEGIESKALKDISAIQNALQGSTNPEKEALASIAAFTKQGTTAELFDPEQNSEKEAMQAMNDQLPGDMSSRGIGLPNNAIKDPSIFGDMINGDNVINNLPEQHINIGFQPRFGNMEQPATNLDGGEINFDPELTDLGHTTNFETNPYQTTNNQLTGPNQNEVPMVIPPDHNKVDFSNQNIGQGIGTEHALKNKDAALEEKKKEAEQEFTEETRLADEKFQQLEDQRSEEERKNHGNARAVYVGQRKEKVVSSHKSKENLSKTHKNKNLRKRINKNAIKGHKKQNVLSTNKATKLSSTSIKNAIGNFKNSTGLRKSFDSAIENSDSEYDYGPSEEHDGGDDGVMSK